MNQPGRAYEMDRVSPLMRPAAKWRVKNQRHGEPHPRRPPSFRRCGQQHDQSLPNRAKVSREGTRRALGRNENVEAH